MDKECEKYWKNMADYFFTLAPIVNGPYYAGQMALAARLLDIVIREGGNDEYRNVESEDPSDWNRPEDFIPKVNMRNATRFIHKEDKVHFCCDAQCVRFHKAWHLFLRILNEKMFNNWWD